LKRHSLVKSRPRRRRTEIRRATPLCVATAPNDCWSADHKGYFVLGNGSRCYPLTITDNFSRYLFTCQALPGIDLAPARRFFEAAFREHGLPTRIRTDNGTPFGASRGLALSSLSLWWMRLGIVHERIAPGRPTQNGRHERVHRTLLDEVLDEKATPNFRTEQRRFDQFRDEYNNERPHEALQMKRPAKVYASSPRPLPNRIEKLSYPREYSTQLVHTTGRISYRGATYFLSKVLAGEDVGLQQIDTEELRVWAGHLPLGVLDYAAQTFTAYTPDEQLEVA
jgi:putative transposase